VTKHFSLTAIREFKKAHSISKVNNSNSNIRTKTYYVLYYVDIMNTHLMYTI